MKPASAHSACDDVVRFAKCSAARAAFPVVRRRLLRARHASVFTSFRTVSGVTFLGYAKYATVPKGALKAYPLAFGERLRYLTTATASSGDGSNGAGSNGYRGDSGNFGGSRKDNADGSLWSKVLESAATSMASILMLGLGFSMAGYGYHKFYKYLVLQKMEKAFEPGDPVLELAAIGRGLPQNKASFHNNHASTNFEDEVDDRAEEFDEFWTMRPEQAAVDAIVSGEDVGHYHLFLGEKGTGKSSMLLEAMAKIDALGVAMFEAHADLEIVRIRLGKALNFDFNEDYIGSYFNERGPRESTALLDIERALNKLEKVALRRRNMQGADHRPLLIIINQMHLIRDDDDGRDLIELLQQRAEQWAAAGLVTMVFNSDDYWVYERLKQLASRLEVHSIQDLTREQAKATLQRFRWRYFNERLTTEMADDVYNRVGGRLTFLNRVARSRDMLRTCQKIIDTEKMWFLNQCWILGADMDDDVMDQQKWAAAAMVLAQALVDKSSEAGEENITNARSKQEPGEAEKLQLPGERLNTETTVDAHLRPSFALHEAQQIMTRADFIREMDRRNLFTITSDSRVRAASVAMQVALNEICGIPGFREHLDGTVQRIADIESLGRTRELVAKDLVLGGRYELSACKEDKRRTKVVFSGWSPHERPPRDPPQNDGL